MAPLSLGDKFLAEVEEYPYGKIEVTAEVVGLNPVEIFAISGGVKNLRYRKFQILQMADLSMSHIDKSFDWCPACAYRKREDSR